MVIKKKPKTFSLSVETWGCVFYFTVVMELMVVRLFEIENSMEV